MDWVGFSNLSKFERIQLLQEYGLNTPDYIFFKRRDLAAINTFLDNVHWAMDKRVSLRFFADEDTLVGSQPHTPNVSWWDARNLLYLHNNDYDIMLSATGINPKDTIICGNLMMQAHGINGYGIAIFEYREGPGTVRDVQHDCVSLTCNLHECPKDVTGRFMLPLAQAKKNALRFPLWNKVIFEWAYYPYPIGAKKNRLIFWEVRRKQQ